MNLDEMPFESPSPAPGKKAPDKKKEPEDNNLKIIPDEDDELDPEDLDPTGLDTDLEDAEEENSSALSPKVIAIIGAVVVVVGIGAYFMFFNKEEEPPPLVEGTEGIVEEEPVDPSQEIKDGLYKIGIGKDSLVEERIYEQGNIESEDFRKDFTNTGVPENYVQPIEIVGVNESVSYIKHRTVMGTGVDVYWVDATYKGQKTAFTIPYYIWQTLAPEGVMDVLVEVITDANDSVFIGSIQAVPPTSE